MNRHELLYPVACYIGNWCICLKGPYTFYWSLHCKDSGHTTNLQYQRPKCQTLTFWTSPRLPQWGTWPFLWSGSLGWGLIPVQAIGLTLLTVFCNFSSLFYHNFMTVEQHCMVKVFPNESVFNTTNFYHSTNYLQHSQVCTLWDNIRRALQTNNRLL